MRAVGTLAEDEQYQGRFEYEIVPMGSERGKASDVIYAWGPEAHGLVVLAPDGSVLEVLKGHNWGGLEPDIALGALRKALDRHL